MPCASVMTTTVGAFKSGNTSTSMWLAVMPPHTSSAADANNISSLLCKEYCIILFNIEYDLSVNVHVYVPEWLPKRMPFSPDMPLS